VRNRHPAETGNASPVHGVGKAQGQRQLRPGHHQIHPFSTGKIHKLRYGIRGYGHILRNTRCAAVAGSRKNLIFRILSEFPGQGVLTPAGTDNENTHEGSCVVADAGGGPLASFAIFWYLG